jgi:uracil DNA glycosylase
MCRDAFLQDAVEEERAQHEQQYKMFLAELELRSKDDIKKRAEDGALLLNKVMEVAAQIVETNQKIQ